VYLEWWVGVSEMSPALTRLSSVPDGVPMEKVVDFLEKSGKEIFVGSVKFGLTAESSGTQTEERGPQSLGASPFMR
jgi:hypothetical protein